MKEEGKHKLGGKIESTAPMMEEANTAWGKRTE